MIGKNNPFNIRYVKSNIWKGQKGQTKGFCNFESIELGLRAGFILLRNYVYRKGLHSVEEIISRFAPSSENNTSEYISFVSGVLRSNGIESDNLNQFCPEFILGYNIVFFHLVSAILRMESNYHLTLYKYRCICTEYNINY